jgi:signal transduction histidine kinase
MTLSMAITTIVSTSILVVIFYFSSYYTARKMLVDSTQAQANVIAKNIHTDMLFGAPESATRTLESLAGNKDILTAAVYRNGSLFAWYPIDAKTKVPPKLDPNQSTHFSSRELHVTAQSVTASVEPVIGEVELVITLMPFKMRIHSLLLVLIIGSVISTAASVFLAFKYAKQITKPLKNLESLMKYVRETHDYTARYDRPSDTEIGRLGSAVDGFFEQIQLRDAAIKVHRESLEQTVQDRTVELTKAKLKAEQASQIKSDFLSNMSHELRTPLTAIQLYTEMVQEVLEARQDSKDLVEFLGKVQLSNRHLLSLIDDILDLARVEAGRMAIEFTLLNLEDLVFDVHTQASALMEQNYNRFEVDSNYNSEQKLLTDGRRLKQILLNLLSNAAKFTEDGIIYLRVNLVDDNVVFEVEDTGIGMNGEQIVRVWGEFEQADASTSKRYGGTGLGLALTKRFTELLGGVIILQSTPNVGTKFVLTIPMRGPDESLSS